MTLLLQPWLSQSSPQRGGGAHRKGWGGAAEHSGLSLEIQTINSREEQPDEPRLLRIQSVAPPTTETPVLPPPADATPAPPGSSERLRLEEFRAALQVEPAPTTGEIKGVSSETTPAEPRPLTQSTYINA